MGTYSPAVIEAVPTSKAVPAVKRQRRSLDEKRRIVEETLAPDASVARVARARGVNANQVFQWRRLYGQGRLGNPPASVARLLPVSIAETTSATILGGANGTVAPGTIHLELRKARVRIEGNIDPAVLRLVLQSVLR